MMNNKLQISLVWVRKDFRLLDNPALYYAAQQGNVLPVFIYDTNSSYQPGLAAQCWLHYALQDFNNSIDNKLHIYQGNCEDILVQIVSKYSIKNIYFNRCYEPEQIVQDRRIQKRLEELGVACHIFHSQLLWDPAKILTGYKTPYKVFTPFYYNGCLHAQAPQIPLGIPEHISWCDLVNDTMTIENLRLLDQNQFYNTLGQYWNISEAGALARLDFFVHNGLSGYKEHRNIPRLDGTSLLSPYLHFGQISVNQVWATIHKYQTKVSIDDVSSYLSELGWREFCYNLLFHNPYLPYKNFNEKFDNYPWSYNEQLFNAWKLGKTGIPIVDAGMRQLAQTGYMHNRVRMIVASFLIKNLGIHWKYGQEWFWQCLVDADLANNSANWQWVAGSGADAAPFFRIFNPILQGEKFDAEGIYTKKYVPELALLPDKYVHKPWKAPVQILRQAGIRLGDNYPEPIVDLDLSRKKALDAYKKL